jgi:hypothetical protein
MHDQTYDPEAAFEANLKAAEKAHAEAGLDENGLGPGQSHPSQRVAPDANPDAVQAALMKQNYVDPLTGRRPYVEDDAYREQVERELQAAMAGEAAPAPQPGQSQPSPVDDIVSRWESGIPLSKDEVPAQTWQQITHGYDINLPAGYGLTREHAEGLAAMRAEGYSQEQVNAVVKRMLRGGS